MGFKSSAGVAPLLHESQSAIDADHKIMDRIDLRFSRIFSDHREDSVEDRDLFPVPEDRRGKHSVTDQRKCDLPDQNSVFKIDLFLFAK